MTTTKNVSNSTYVGAHAGAIAYHALTAILLIFSQFTKTVFSIPSRKIVIYLASLLLIISLLAIWPIAMNYDEIVIKK